MTIPKSQKKKIKRRKLTPEEKKLIWAAPESNAKMGWYERAVDPIRYVDDKEDK